MSFNPFFREAFSINANIIIIIIITFDVTTHLKAAERWIRPGFSFRWNMELNRKQRPSPPWGVHVSVGGVGGAVLSSLPSSGC